MPGAFILALTQVLSVNAEHVTPAYEDIWYYLWRRAAACL
jgi:hypothetical protein